MGLEMRAVLVRLESGLVAEQFVEQKLRGIVPCLADQEQFGAGLALRLGQKAAQNAGDLVGLSLLGCPWRAHQQAAAADGIADGSFVDGISIHVVSPWWFALIVGRCAARSLTATVRYMTNDVRKCFDNGRSDDVAGGEGVLADDRFGFQTRPCAR